MTGAVLVSIAPNYGGSLSVVSIAGRDHVDNGNDKDNDNEKREVDFPRFRGQ
jgi:hypothetical protein